MVFGVVAFLRVYEASFSKTLNLKSPKRYSLHVGLETYKALNPKP